MERTWRWFGKKDKITLAQLRQIGVEGIVTALHDDHRPLQSLSTNMLPVDHAATGLYIPLLRLSSKQQR